VHRDHSTRSLPAGPHTHPEGAAQLAEPVQERPRRRVRRRKRPDLLGGPGDRGKPPVVAAVHAPAGSIGQPTRSRYARPPTGPARTRNPCRHARQSPTLAAGPALNTVRSRTTTRRHGRRARSVGGSVGYLIMERWACVGSCCGLRCSGFIAGGNAPGDGHG
jgi:hypothetical protein